MIGVRYERAGTVLELELEERPEPEKMAELLNGIRERFFPGVAIVPYVEPERPVAKPQPKPRRISVDLDKAEDWPSDWPAEDLFA